MRATLRADFQTGKTKKRTEPKRMPLVRPVCRKCGATMVVYATRSNGSGVVRYWKCWRKDCTFRKKKNDD